MGVIRAEPARVTDWAAKSVGAAWRAFDLQLTTYAGLLVADRSGDGLHEQRRGRVASRSRRARRSAAGLMWAAIAVVVFVLATAFDYHWLKTLAWPIYAFQLGLLVLTLAIGDGVGGSARWVSVGPLTFQFSEIAKILMIIVLASYLASREGKLDSLALDRRAPACWSARRSSSSCSSPTSGRRSSSGRSSPGCSGCRAPACAGWPSSAVGVVAMVPIAWTYLLRDYQKARLTSFLDAEPGHPGRRLPALPGADRRRLGRALRQGPDQRDADPGRLPARPGHRLRVRDAGRGARVHRRRRPVRPVRPAAVAGPRRRLAVARRVRDPVRGRRRLDGPVPARRQRRDGPRGHADHRHPAPVRDPRRRLARQHGRRPRDPPEHQHPQTKAAW